MTVTQSLLSFLFAAGLLTITPGLDTALVLRTATVEGSKHAALAAAGVILGCLTWGIAAAVGLGALLAASETAFLCLKWLGVAYLLWLGGCLVFRPRKAFSIAETQVNADRRTGNAFWRGLAQNLLNPKVGVFYVSFLPQFIPSGVSVAGFTLLLALLHDAMGLVWFSGLILATRPLLVMLRRPAVVTWMDRLTGCVFVGFGIKLAMVRR